MKQPQEAEEELPAADVRGYFVRDSGVGTRETHRCEPYLIRDVHTYIPMYRYAVFSRGGEMPPEPNPSNSRNLGLGAGCTATTWLSHSAKGFRRKFHTSRSTSCRVSTNIKDFKLGNPVARYHQSGETAIELTTKRYLTFSSPCLC